MRSLIIEDDADTGQYVCNGLREAGFAVTWCRNGADGLHLAANEEVGRHDHRPDVAGRVDGLASSRLCGPRQDDAGVDSQCDRQPGRARTRAFTAAATITLPSHLPSRSCWRASRRCSPHARSPRRSCGTADSRPRPRYATVRANAPPPRSPATARIAPARISGAPSRPGRHAHHVARGGLGLPFRSADQRRRRADQPPCAEGRQGFSPPLIHTMRGAGYMLGPRAYAEDCASSIASRSTALPLIHSVGMQLALGNVATAPRLVISAVFYFGTVGVIDRSVDGKIARPSRGVWRRLWRKAAVGPQRENTQELNGRRRQRYARSIFSSTGSRASWWAICRAGRSHRHRSTA